MKTPKKPLFFTVDFPGNPCPRIAATCLAVSAMALSSTAHAADIEWADSAGNTTWTTSNVADSTPASDSWVGGFAPANSVNTDTAIFTSVSNAQPNLTVQTRIRGIEFEMAAGGLAMTGGGGTGNVLSIGGGGINARQQISGTNTITNARIGLLGANSTWTFFSDADTAGTSTFTVNSTVNMGSRNLTVVGQRNSATGNVGIINFDRAIDGTSGILTIDSANANNTVNLNAANTYTGATNVNGGTLIVNGDISTSSLTTVASGATISGSGTVGALTVSTGGFINPGNSPGTLDVDGDYSQLGLYTAEINGLTAGTQHDQINVSGTVNITGGSLATMFTGTYAANDLLFILLNDSTDAITGNFSGLAQGATVTSYGGFDWQISYIADSTGNSFTGGNDIALMAIPEPSAALLGGLGIMLALLRRRRA